MSPSLSPWSSQHACVPSSLYPVTVSTSCASLAVLGTRVTTVSQEQLSRCSEWCLQVTKGVPGGPSLRLREYQRGGPEVTLWLTQRDEESDNERGIKGSRARGCRVGPHLGPPRSTV